jgi:hypothetical protein
MLTAPGPTGDGQMLATLSLRQDEWPIARRALDWLTANRAEGGGLGAGHTCIVCGKGDFIARDRK